MLWEAFDSLAPASSPFGLPVYVARVPAAPFCETPILNAAADPTTDYTDNTDWEALASRCSGARRGERLYNNVRRFTIRLSCVRRKLLEFFLLAR